MYEQFSVAVGEVYLRCWFGWKKTLGNSADKLCHTRSVAYSGVLILPNKHQISYLHYYQMLFYPRVNFPDRQCPIFIRFRSFQKDMWARRTVPWWIGGCTNGVEIW